MEKLKDFTVSQLILITAGILALLFTLVYGNAGWGLVLLCISLMIFFEYFFAFRKNKRFNPYALMILSPLLLLKYSSIIDFRIRVTGFILLIYIINAAYSQNRRKIKFSLAKAKPITVWFTAFAVFALAAIVVWFQGIHLSGDEPHYIMITQSLVEDGDFDLKNNFEEKAYLDYIPVEVRFHGGDYNGKYLSFHLPGVSFLLIPFYWLFKLVGGFIPAALYFRLAAGMINAFFALCLFYILKRKFPKQDITGFWLLFLLIFPLLFHSIHLYPELPAATLMMAAYYFTFFDKKNYLLAGLFLSLVPWFHVKYIPPLILLAVVIIYSLFKPFKPFKPFEKAKIKALLQFFIFPVVGFILLVIYSKTLYGSFSPTAVFPKESYWAVPWLLRVKVFLAYFLDQRDGLLFYSPLFFLFFFAFKKKLQNKYLLLGIAFVYVFFHAFTTVRGAFAPAGRPLMFVSWIFIIFIAHFYYNIPWESPNFLSHFTYRFLAGLSFFVVVWLFYYPLFLYQPVFAGTVERASGFNLFWGSDFIWLWQFFPSFLTMPRGLHLGNVRWIIFLALALLIYYTRPLKIIKKSFLNRPNAVIPLLLFLWLSFLYCFYPHVHLVSENKYTDRVISFYNNSRNFHYVPDRKEFRIKAGNYYDIFIDRKLVRKDEVTFHFTNTDVNDVTIRNGKRLLFELKSTGKKEVSLSFRISSLTQLKVGNKLVSHIGIETHTKLKDSFLWLKVE